MKRLLALGLLALSACATAHAVPNRQTRYFYCAADLDAASCRLVRSGAYWATQRGYPTVEHPGAGLEFVPAENRSVFLGKRAPLKTTGATVECSFLPGGVALRDGDLVGIIEDMLVLNAGEGK